jgi:hypothetical protein
MTINRDLGIEGDETAARILEFMDAVGKNSKPKPEGAFQKITLAKSSGFAGVNVNYSIDATGTIKSDDKPDRKLSRN